MSTPQRPAPDERRKQAVESQIKGGAANRETNRPSDSVPVVAGQFAHLPARFGRYEVQKLLGRGAMGAVYLARDTQLERLVALKIPKVATSGSKRLLARLETEAKAAAQLDHPSLCKVYDAGEVDGQCFIAMQYIEGETLKTQLEAKRKSVEEAVSLIVQLAEGLSEAHARGIIHRDLKPENIMINRRGTPVIMDFGLAKFSTMTGNAAATQAGTILGSPAYMSPEQASGRIKEIDERSDIYALGVILFELLTGKWPFTGSAMQILGQKSLMEPASPLSLNPDLHPQLAAICHKMVAKQNADRHQSLAEVIADLKGIDLDQPTLSLTASEAGPAAHVAFADFVAASQVDERAASLSKRKSSKPTVRQAAVEPQTLPQRMGAWWNGQPPAKKWTVLGGAAFLFLCGVIIIKITIEFDDGKIPKGEAKKGSVATVEPVKPPGPAPAKSKWHGWPADAPSPAIAPFDAAQAKVHQQAWATYLKVPVEYTNSIGMKFVLIPPGEFMMGSTQQTVEALLLLPEARRLPQWQAFVRSEAPRHKVILTQPIYLGVHEVTQGEFLKVMGNNPSYFSKMGGGQADVVGIDTIRHPVELVSWNNAVEFCEKLSQREGFKPFRLQDVVTAKRSRDDTGYRLPTEAGWEFACRAGTISQYWPGDKEEDLGQAAWFNSNGGIPTHAVGMRNPNPFGLYDIHGNIWEWVQDAWESTYYGTIQGDVAVDPLAPVSTDSLRVFRGGHGRDPATFCRSSNRDARAQEERYVYIGFRVSLSVDAVRQAVAAPPLAIAPFDADKAKASQETWAKHLGVPVEYTNTIGMKFVLIPPGEFTMGSSTAEIEAALVAAGEAHVAADEEEYWKKHIRSEAPWHKVILTQPIYLAVNEVTQMHYEAVMGKNPSHFSTMGAGKVAIPGIDTTSHPVEMVSWIDAVEFCKKLSRHEQFELNDGSGYRLPREAEWEFACRGGSTTRYWNGNNDGDLPLAGWIDTNSHGRTHPTSQLKANPFGLFDVHGNVWEWVQDKWDPDYYATFQQRAAVDPIGPPSDGSRYVIRGGNWRFQASGCRSSGRSSLDPKSSTPDIGFRVSLPVNAVKRTLSSAPLVTVLFAADEAQAKQTALAKQLDLPIEFTNSIGMKFVLIPPGEFIMGSTAKEIEDHFLIVGANQHWKTCLRSELPRHKVTLTKPFYLGMHEITQKDYVAIMGVNPSHFSPSGAGRIAVAGIDTDSHPVEKVSWNDAVEFCQRFSVQQKLKPCYQRVGQKVTLLTGDGYRLPTEAEWEWACRAGTTSRYWVGDLDPELERVAWTVVNSLGRTHKVGERQANPFGLFDMHGNVEEWVQDAWEPTYYHQFLTMTAVDPVGPASTIMRVLRGGNWKDSSINCRSAFRYSYDPSNTRNIHIGFRVSLSTDGARVEIAEIKKREANADDKAVDVKSEITKLTSKPTSESAPTYMWPKDAPAPAIAPFNAVQAKLHQAAWAKYLNVAVEFTNKQGMKFILIPPGEYTRGSTAAEIELALKAASDIKQWQDAIKSEAPQHKVTLTRPIYLGVTEVTQAQYLQVMGKNPSHFAPTGAGKAELAISNTAKYPVEKVSWDDAVEFCAKLNQLEKLKPLPAQAGKKAVRLEGAVYRLPTEAEWEFACRAGTNTRYWIGDLDRDLTPAAWTGANAFGRTHEVGKVRANPFGLYDMHGNVWEWVQDAWDPAAYKQYFDQPAIDPLGPAVEPNRLDVVPPERVFRGGDWSNSPSASRSSMRHFGSPSARFYFKGFRVALVIGGPRVNRL